MESCVRLQTSEWKFSDTSQGKIFTHSRRLANSRRSLSHLRRWSHGISPEVNALHHRSLRLSSLPLFVTPSRSEKEIHKTRTMENLPGEVLSDILKRLLAKQVAQMGCVSKPWNALLSDPSFIKSHLNHSIQNNDSVLLFFGGMISFELHHRTPFTARPSSSPDLQLPDFLKLPVIYHQPEFGLGTVIGSVHGLVCFYYMSSSDQNAIHIWNPCLCATTTLPSSSLPKSSHLQCGFGFDPISNDYKVIRLTTIGDSPQCDLYRVRTGSWESISQRLPSHIRILGGRDQVCVNCLLHWLAFTDLEDKPLTILAFDLGEEVFIQIPLPEPILDSNWYKRRNVLGVLGGKLCVITRAVKDGEWEVWVMEEYGVGESWVKNQGFPPYSGDISPYGFTSKGEFVFRVDEDEDSQCMRFGLYDPVEAKTKTFKITWRQCNISRFVEYVDSLVWIQPPNHEINNSCDISRLQIGE